MRQIARHLWIAELLQGEYEEREGWEPNILHTGRGDVVRCNVIGTLLSVGGNQVLDDGTGQIALRAFEEVPGLREAKSGQMVQVVGRPRRYQQNYYLIPEVLRPVAAEWALVRKRELGEVRPFERRAPAPEPEEESPVHENKADHVLAVIDGLDSGDGAAVDEVVAQAKLGDEAERILNQLLLDGEVFEIKPGVVKIL